MRRKESGNATTGFLTKAGTLILAFLAPVHTVMLATGGMVVADLVTGIWRARKKRQKFSSFKLRRTVTKFTAYQIAVVTAMIIERYLVNVDGVPIVKTVAASIALVELQSIRENLTDILGKDIFMTLLSKLQPPKHDPVDKN